MKRKLFIFSIFCVFFIILYQINGLNHVYYSTLYEQQTNKIVYGSSAMRGRILDRNGKVLVDNEGYILVVYHKPVNETVENQIYIASLLTPFLKDFYLTETNLKNYYLATNNNGKELITESEWQLWDERKLTNEDISKLKWERIINEMIEYSLEEQKIIYLFSKMNEGYSYEDKVLLEDVSDEELAKITELQISSIRSVIEARRVYPYEDTLKSIFGSIGSIPAESLSTYLNDGYAINDIVGVSGLEKEYENILKGKKAKYVINSDNTLTLIEESKPGSDIVLNIDIDVQLKLESILKEEMILASKRKTSTYFHEAYAMVGDPKTGGVLALSGLKMTDEKTFQDITITAFTSSYAMGSVVKGASNTLGYLTGAIEVGKKIKDSCVKLYSEPAKCSYTSLGYVDDITALKTSSNYYQFITAIRSTGQKYSYNMKFSVTEENFQKYRDVFASYGLGTKTEIDFPIEYTGIKGTTIAGDLLLNFAIGQYDTYTPISLMQYIHTIAMYGNRYALKLKKESYNTFLNQVGLEEGYYDRITEGMYQVFHGGTASSYVAKNLEAVGKTGTAETFYDSDADGIVDTPVINSTLAYYFPRSDPKYSVVIVAPYLTNSSSSSYPFTKYVSLKISKYLSSL